MIKHLNSAPRFIAYFSAVFLWVFFIQIGLSGFIPGIVLVYVASLYWIDYRKANREFKKELDKLLAGS